jgi:hypothetical protein
MQELVILKELLPQLANLSTKLPFLKVMVGFDGYVDKIQQVVQKRSDIQVDYYQKIPHLAEKIHQAANKSCQLELVTHTLKLGGNAPIMANALAFLGIRNYCVGAMGEPKVEAIFSQTMHQLVDIQSISSPAFTNALEFQDGKLILSELTNFQTLNWAKIKSVLSLSKIRSLVADSQLIAMVDWANLPHCDDIWCGILTEVAPFVAEGKIYFFDLTDLAKKSDIEVDNVLKIIRGFGKFGEVILGLNENESEQLFHIVKRLNNNELVNESNLTAKGKYIYQYLGIDYLLIHPLDRSIIFSKKESLELKGKLITQPKISTGGGDNLNAGFCFAKLCEFNLAECLMLGMATSGAYVANGQSPSLSELSKFINEWITELND